MTKKQTKQKKMKQQQQLTKMELQNFTETWLLNLVFNNEL